MSTTCRVISWFRNATALLSLLISSLVVPIDALALSGDDLARDYLIQKICLDAFGRVQLVDPYYCPAGGTLRSLEPGEALPYHRYDQLVADRPNDRQHHDSYPIKTHDGQEMVANPFHHAPFGQFDASRDGYDITVVRDGWTSVSETRAGRGATTFFGAGCKPYGAWVFFPISALGSQLVQPGEARIPIKGVHWERNGEPWPGRCPSEYQANTLTSWEPLLAFKFGGIGVTPIKTIDAIRSVHGQVDSPQFRAHGHLEVFYFTRLYGLTRWESWATKERYDNDPELLRRGEIASRRCNGPVENIYKGITFERIACRDWSAIEVLVKPEAPLQLPLPDLK
jgi:hypothetical protein